MGTQRNRRQQQSVKLNCLDSAFEDARLTGVLALRDRAFLNFPGSAAEKYDLTDTHTVDLSCNGLLELPELLGSFWFLEMLIANKNSIDHVAKSLNCLTALTFVDLRCNSFNDFPAVLCSLPLEVLLLGNNKITSIPEHICQLGKTLTELDLSCNLLSFLPVQLGRLSRLSVLNLRRNFLVELPQELNTLPLGILEISHNRIGSLPANFRRLLTTLHHFAVEGNPLISPPLAICCRGLVHIFKYFEKLEANSCSPNAGHLEYAADDKNNCKQQAPFASRVYLKHPRLSSKCCREPCEIASTSGSCAQSRPVGSNIALLCTNEDSLSQQILSECHSILESSCVADCSSSDTYRDKAGRAEAIQESQRLNSTKSSCFDYRTGTRSIELNGAVPKTICAPPRLDTACGYISPFNCMNKQKLMRHNAKSDVIQLLYTGVVETSKSALCGSPLKQSSGGVLLNNNHIRSPELQLAKENDLPQMSSPASVPLARSESLEDCGALETNRNRFRNSWKIENISVTAEINSRINGRYENCSDGAEAISALEETESDIPYADVSFASADLSIADSRGFVDNCKNLEKLDADVAVGYANRQANGNSMSKGTSFAITPRSAMSHRHSLPSSKSKSRPTASLTGTSATSLKPRTSERNGASAVATKPVRAENGSVSCRTAAAVKKSLEKPSRKPARSSIDAGLPFNAMQEEPFRAFQSLLKVKLPDSNSEIARILCDGILLCRFANILSPGIVSVIHQTSAAVPKLSPIKARQNVYNFLMACRKLTMEEIGCTAAEISDVSGKHLAKVSATIAALHRSSAVNNNVELRLSDIRDG